jgi:hypothetical protein
MILWMSGLYVYSSTSVAKKNCEIATLISVPRSTGYRDVTFDCLIARNLLSRIKFIDSALIEIPAEVTSNFQFLLATVLNLTSPPPVPCTGVVKIPTTCQSSAAILATLHPAGPWLLVTVTFQWRQKKTLIYCICGILQCFSWYNDGAMGWTARVRFPAGSWDCTRLCSIQTGSRALSASYQVSTRASFLRGKAAEAYHSLPSSAEVKNGGAIPPLLRTSSCRCV